MDYDKAKKEGNMVMDGEKFFEPVLESFGFIKVDREVGAKIDFENADFVNKNSRVIVEIKTVETEYFSEGGIICETNALIVKPLNINDNGTGQYTLKIDSDKKPKNIIYEPLRRLLKKASSQIKSTKDYYFKDDKGPDSIGIVLLVLKNSNIIPITQAALIVDKCLMSGLSVIDGVCICTPFSLSKDPITGNINPTDLLVVRTEDEDKAEMCGRFAEIINAAIKLHNNEPQDVIHFTECPNK